MQNGQLYCDSRTREALADGGNHVLLLGGYGGYANFGDILQLRRSDGIRLTRDSNRFWSASCIRFLTRDFPSACANGSEWTRSLCRRGIRCFRKLVAALSEPPRIPWLHVYGGGFLNSYWAPVYLPLIERLHHFFGVGFYALSGQQIDPKIAPELTRHFAECRPVVAGGRDHESVEILSRCGAPAAYSFDDAMEPWSAMVEESKHAAQVAGIGRAAAPERLALRAGG